MALRFPSNRPPLWRRTHTLRRFATTGVVAAALSVVPPAAADEPRHPESVSQEAVPGLLVAARIGAGAMLSNVGFLTRVEGGYRIIPSLLVGASMEVPISMTLSDGDGCADASVTCTSHYILANARAEFQPWTDFIVGPWIGVEIGGLAPIGDNTKSLLPATGADAGFEVRPLRSFSVGAYIATTFLFANPYVYDPFDYYGGSGFHLEGGSVGVRIAGRLDVD